MNQIDVGKLKVSPFTFVSIEEIRIEKALNEHSTLYVCGLVSEEDNITPVKDMTQGTPICFENDGHVYFSGVLTNIKIKCEGSQYRLYAHASSNTILLDVTKHRRSFQDNEMTYKSIVEYVIQEEEGTVEYHADEMTVENIILQYDETDWEFAKRLASHTQDVLIPIVSEDKPTFHLGVPDGEAEMKVRNEFTIERNFNAYRGMSNQENPLTDEDVTFYTVRLGEYVCELGEPFNLNGMDLHVFRLSLSLIGSALTVDYVLASKEALSSPKRYNRAIIGLTIDGKVLSMTDDRVKLYLVTDIEEDEPTAHLFKYATGYTAEKHTGWYVMPEVGDTVQLYFPAEDEKFAHATSSIRQEDTTRTQDHMVKYWRTADGKEIKLDRDEILITAHDAGEIGSEITYIRLHETRGIEIHTPRPISIWSGGTLKMESVGDMTIATQSNLLINANSSITMANGNNIMTFTPQAGIATTTNRQIRTSSGGNTSIMSSSALNVNSTGNMGLDSGAQIDIVAGGSSISLDGGGIDALAPEIKLN